MASAEEDALQRTLDAQRPALAATAAAHPAATRAWLGRALQSDAGTVEFYGLLEEAVEAPGFVGRLETARAAAAGAAATAPTPTTGTDVLRPEWWQDPAPATPTTTTGTGTTAGPPPPGEALDSYIFVERADVTAAVAAFVAAYIATLPDGAALPPKDLAAALGCTLRELRRGRAARLWGWGKALYRAAAVASGAFGAYTHPWLARAVLAAVWTGARALLAGLVG